MVETYYVHGEWGKNTSATAATRCDCQRKRKQTTPVVITVHFCRCLPRSNIQTFPVKNASTILLRTRLVILIMLTSLDISTYHQKIGLLRQSSQHKLTISWCLVWLSLAQRTRGRPLEHSIICLHWRGWFFSQFIGSYYRVCSFLFIHVEITGGEECWQKNDVRSELWRLYYYYWCQHHFGHVLLKYMVVDVLYSLCEVNIMRATDVCASHSSII